ncbi:glycosyltransferase [Amycolatopsis nigrescens]|uniref:glycosyltransferase n=1 Tax=Amycolatopsis nigrescens TaxID=381445 RepID=UPI00037CB132|nr:nucleotide disphospho-sugar-binding domain-containing protein [Amycolatopsis nigrescens]
MPGRRFLFVAPPLTGHVNPLRGVAAELAAGGDEVAWAGPEPALGKLTGGARVYPAGDSAEFSLDRRPGSLRGFAALKFLWEQYLVPLADAMTEPVAAAVRDFAPDVLVADQQAMAGALVASREGLPWATSASTSSELSDPLAALPKVAAWVAGLQAGLRARHGVHTDADLRFSPELLLAFTTEALAGRPALPVPVRYVGPAYADRAESVDFPWDQVRERPLVLVTLGTANEEAGRRFLAAAAEALSSLSGRFQGVIADPAGVLGDLQTPGTVVVRRIPQLALIRRAAVVLCHGGHNTVCETLGHGVPLVVAPIRDDQPVLAQQVVDAGAGVRLRFDRATPDDIRAAILEVTSSPPYAANARRIRSSFTAAGGPTSAARALRTLT